MDQKASVADETIGLTGWLERLETTELPVLEKVVSELNALTADNDASVNQLTKAILKDGNLTSKVLKIANSVAYNPGGRDITTISRAVVLLGFQAVRRICVSAALMETLLSKGHKIGLLECLGDAFHAALQARNLCTGVDQAAKEQIFIATLLSNVGEMVFWSCGGTQADSLAKLKAEKPFHSEGYERPILGTSFAALSMNLSKRWSLSSLLQEVLQSTERPNRRTRIVNYGISLSRAAKSGFQAPEFTGLLKEVSVFSGQQPDDLMESIRAHTEEARIMAASYGIPPEAGPTDEQEEKEQDPSAGADLREKMHVLLDLVKEAATPENGTINQSEEIKAQNRAHQDDLQRKMSSLSNVIMDALDAKESHTPAKSTGKTPDKNLQLEILFELSNMIVERVSVNRIFQLLVEGMHRGISLDRVMIAPLNVRTKELKVTYVLGQDTESWQTGINFSTRQLGILHTLYRSPQSLWLGQDPEEEGDSQLASLLDHGHCFVAALTIGPRMVAVVYADQSGQELTKEQFSSFRHFVQQTNFGLLTLANG